MSLKPTRANSPPVSEGEGEKERERERERGRDGERNYSYILKETGVLHFLLFQRNFGLKDTALRRNMDEKKICYFLHVLVSKILSSISMWDIEKELKL